MSVKVMLRWLELRLKVNISLNSSHFIIIYTQQQLSTAFARNVRPSPYLQPSLCIRLQIASFYALVIWWWW